MKDFLLFTVKFVVGFFSYIVGTIIAVIGCVVVVGGFMDEYWSMMILGVPVFVLGAWMASWMQYKR